MPPSGIPEPMEEQTLTSLAKAALAAAVLTMGAFTTPASAEDAKIKHMSFKITVPYKSDITVATALVGTQSCRRSSRFGRTLWWTPSIPAMWNARAFSSASAPAPPVGTTRGS
jgi:hypothetical protein